MSTIDKALEVIKPFLERRGLEVREVTKATWYGEDVGWVLRLGFGPGQHVGMPPVYSVTRSGLLMGPDQSLRLAKLRLLDWYTLPDDPELPV